MRNITVGCRRDTYADNLKWIYVMPEQLRCILIDPPVLPVNVSAGQGIEDAHRQDSSYPPVGLAYLAAVLKQKGVPVNIIDAKSLALSHDEVINMVMAEEPEVVGVTVFTTQLRSALNLCREIKELFPSTIVVVGGPHIHFEHESLIRKPFIDFCVRGEGEYALSELIDALANGRSLNKIRGLTFRSGETVVVNSDRPPISGLDVLPFPARELLPENTYKAIIGNGEKKRFAAVTATRGCQFRCRFCSVPRLWPTQRRRSAANVLDELERIYAVNEITNIRFTDENLSLNKQWLTTLCQGMIDRGLSDKMAWSCDSRVDTISEDILSKMRKANCRVVFYGIEFGDQSILDFSGKGTTLGQIHRAVEMTRNADILPHGNFMIGYPTENHKTIERTIELARILDLDEATFSIVTPFPGTDLFDYCKNQGLLKTDNWEEFNMFNPRDGTIRLDAVPGEELMNLYKRARYVFNFKYIKEEFEQELANF